MSYLTHIVHLYRTPWNFPLHPLHAAYGSGVGIATKFGAEKYVNPCFIIDLDGVRNKWSSYKSSSTL